MGLLTEPGSARWTGFLFHSLQVPVCPHPIPLREGEREEPSANHHIWILHKKKGDLLTNWQQIVCKFSIVQATVNLTLRLLAHSKWSGVRKRGGGMEERKGAGVGVSHWSCFATTTTTTTVWGGPQISRLENQIKKVLVQLLFYYYAAHPGFQSSLLV